jgi:hypothetical protein
MAYRATFDESSTEANPEASQDGQAPGIPTIHGSLMRLVAVARWQTDTDYPPSSTGYGPSAKASA